MKTALVNGFPPPDSFSLSVSPFSSFFISFSCRSLSLSFSRFPHLILLCSLLFNHPTQGACSLHMQIPKRRARNLHAVIRCPIVRETRDAMPFPLGDNCETKTAERFSTCRGSRCRSTIAANYLTPSSARGITRG